MTLRRLRESRAGMLTGMSSSNWNDPAAIPPPNMSSMSRAGVSVTAHTSLQVDVVHTSLRVISNAIIKMRDPRAYRTAYDPENRPYHVQLDPQPGILTNTFGDMFQYDGRRRTVISLALFGEAFWYTLTRDYLGYPTALEVLNPLFVTVNQNDDGTPAYFYGTGTNKKPLATKDVTHIPFMAVPGARRGLSSIDYGGVQYALALAAMEYGQRWFSQGASPSFLLSTEAKLGTEEVTRIAQRFITEHAGLSQSHLPLVLDSGLKAQKISSTPDEAQFLGTLEYSRTCIASWFGLPSHLVGGANDKGMVWGKTVQEQGYQMQDYTLSGYIVPMEEAYASLLPRGQNVEFDEAMITRANARDLAMELIALRSMSIETVNEIRATKLFLGPIEGGDVLNVPLASNVAANGAGSIIKAGAESDGGGSDSGGN